MIWNGIMISKQTTNEYSGFVEKRASNPQSNTATTDVPAEVFEEDSQLKDKEMYDLKHDLIEAQIEVENLKKEKEELEQQMKKLEQDMENLLK